MLNNKKSHPTHTATQQQTTSKVSKDDGGSTCSTAAAAAAAGGGGTVLRSLQLFGTTFLGETMKRNENLLLSAHLSLLFRCCFVRYRTYRTHRTHTVPIHTVVYMYRTIPYVRTVTCTKEQNTSTRLSHK